MKRRRRVWIALLLIAALALGLAWSFHIFDEPPFLTAADVADWDGSGIELRFFDVGQADSILVRCGGECMLVDGGNRDDGPQLLAALTELGVTRFACVVCTHPHEDHAGGLSYITARIPMQRALAPCREADNYWFGDFAALSAQSCGLSVPAAGDEFALGDAKV
ncbi:MAG: MBL fold metallo-hydrolase, partial [Firmicutes bacterium]|nr:MBL fold metallo-hydrolase [Bacillota bacterium]